MATTLQCDIVSAEAQIYSGAVELLVATGVEGELGVCYGHAALLTRLIPGPIRVVDRDGNPGSLETYEMVVRINLIGSFNVLRLGAARMAKNGPIDGERGVVIMTASVAAFEGQIGQIPYASAKAGIVGMTIVAARDLASHQVRVCTIAPGTFDTPILERVKPEVRETLAAAVPHPRRLGRPNEFAMLAEQIIANPMLNGETIRIDGAIRMPPR